MLYWTKILVYEMSSNSKWFLAIGHIEVPKNINDNKGAPNKSHQFAVVSEFRSCIIYTSGSFSQTF